MPGQSCLLFPVIDCGIYGDGDLYQSDINTVVDYVVRNESHSHYYSVRLRYSSAAVPGALESFKILSIALRAAMDSQDSFTHEAFIDRNEETGHISVKLHHTNSEFMVYNIQLTGKSKRYGNKE